MIKKLLLLIALAMTTMGAITCDGTVKTTHKKSAQIFVNKRRSQVKWLKIRDFMDYEMPAYGDLVSVEYDTGKNRITFFK